MSDPTFSVVIPSHNYARFLHTTIESVLQQGRDDVEIIVVDDASTDETPAVLARYEGRVRLISNQTSLGPAGAWARGMDAATGSYVCKLDADDWQLPGCLDAWERAFEAVPDAGAVIGGVHVYVESREGSYEEPVTVSTAYLEPDVFRRRLLGGFFFRMPGLCLRRAALRDHLPPRKELRLPHDWEYFLRVLDGWGAVLLREPVGVYRVHGTSLTTTSHMKDRLRRDVVRLVDIWSDPGDPGHLSGRDHQIAVTAAAMTYLDVVSPTIDVVSLVSHAAQARWVSRHVLAQADVSPLPAWKRLVELLWRRVRARLGTTVGRRRASDVRALLPSPSGDERP